MKKLNLNSERGVTLPEMMIATAIMAVVAFGGFQAYEYFIKQTKKEAAKMDDLSEFNRLTKDLLKFAEGAGISTAYLNLPVKITDCDDSEPCVRKLENEKFVKAEASDLPDILKSEKCMQFFRDGEAVLEAKKAYPDKLHKDKVYQIKDLDINKTPVELMATWKLTDENSPPLILMKSRDGGVVLNYIRSSLVERSLEGNTNDVKHAFFETDAKIDDLMKLKEYPFLVYNSLHISHYVIQYAAEIVSCEKNPAICADLIQKISGATTFNPNDVITGYPNKVYAVKFQAIDFANPFFKTVVDNQKLPDDCKTAWAEGKQSLNSYFFPSTAYSVWQEAGIGSDLAGPDALNILNLSHYYTIRDSSNPGKGLMVALPIDIFSYKVVRSEDGKILSLISELWHATDIKQKTKISNLKGPFTLSRKLGSSELGIWYNPLKTKQGVAP